MRPLRPGNRYRKPEVGGLRGKVNMPKLGRIGKMMPSFPRLNPLPRAPRRKKR